nr:immunoglobulin heavy chain junction region [Mus musculus]
CARLPRDWYFDVW